MATLSVLPPVWLLSQAAAPARPLLWQLDPQQRVKVMMSLLGIVLLGVALVALVMVGGRGLRRIARKRVGPTPGHDEAWYAKPLASFRPKSDPPPPGENDPL
jgi:hypothetical protein